MRFLYRLYRLYRRCFAAPSSAAATLMQVRFVTARYPLSLAAAVSARRSPCPLLRRWLL